MDTLPLERLAPEDRAAVQRLVARARERFGSRLRRVVLYGSKARGDDHPESDVDLLIVLDGPPVDWKERRELSWIAADVSVELGVDLAAKCVGADELARALEEDLPFYRNVEREGVLLWPRD